ncbi:MAG: hypothetical protein GVY13_06685 [Alphaproteobacteria bacterium]|jgi:hypothetical protein|nr:hypothetical protein [Alphaproteobacteria bacterium]
MFRHVLLWKVKDGVEGRSKDEAVAYLCDRVEAIRTEIPQIRALDVGANRAQVGYACDMAVIIDFDSWDDLVAFTEHPAHHALAESVAPYQDAHYVVDYER